MLWICSVLSCEMPMRMKYGRMMQPKLVAVLHSEIRCALMEFYSFVFDMYSIHRSYTVQKKPAYVYIMKALVNRN